MNSSLRYQAARQGLGTLSPEDIKATIKALVDDGLYLDAFLEALDSDSHPRMEEVLPAFLAALRQYQLAIPSREEAVWQLIEHHLQNITSNQANALQELGKLVAEVYWEYDFQTPTKRYLGDSHGIEQLIGLYWSADDMRERPQEITFNGMHGDEAWSELNRQIVMEAIRWLRNQPPNPSIEGTVKGLRPSPAPHVKR